MTPQMMMIDAFDYQDKAIYRGLAGGVTTSLLLHGSANMIGGQAVVIKHKYGAFAMRCFSRMRRDPSSLPAAKIPSGFTVAGTKCLPPAWAILRCSARRLVQAQDYMRDWDAYDAKVKRATKTQSPQA